VSDVCLMIPGPVEAEEDVLFAIGQQTLPHYGPQWMPIFVETTDLLKRLFETTGDALMIPGPGTGGLEAGINSLVPRGEGVCVLDNGFFGMRTVQIVEACGLRPWIITAPWGQHLDPDEVHKQLTALIPQAEAAGHPICALAMVHHETSTGVLNPLKEIAAVTHEFDLPLVVDAVASFGGVRIPVDEWGIDVCVSVPNKCLGTPPGVALVAVSPRAWELVEANPPGHGWYYDLRTWRWYMDNWADWHPYPTTLPTNNIVALHQSLKDIFAEGPIQHFRSFERAAARVREGLGELGFTLYPDPEYAAPVISALNGQPGVDLGDMSKYLLAEYGVMVSGGLGELKGKIIRVGHMGRGRDPRNVERLIDGARAYLRQHAPA
jgi:alanine-glyoxylate transaminase/serine-glyoxylate transaminase/serine-pyruvate transaminase